MALRVDFGGSYNESQQRKANEIYVKIQNTFSKFEMSDKDFFELMKTNIDGYYFSSANFDRTAENRNNGDKLIRNIFLRPRIDSEFSQMLEGNGFILIGDVFINPREERSYFSVNDFYLCENSSQMEYEVFANAPINLRTLYDEWDLRQTNTVLNLDLISELPYIVSPIKFKRFIKKWESYLEFEYELTKMGIKYKTIKNLRFDVLYEVNANEINRDTYKNDILVEFEKKLYVKENSQYLTGEENQYVFASIELDKSSDLKSFFNQSLSLVAKRRKGLLDKLINGEDVEDIVQVPLGEFLMSKDTEFKTTIAYFYVPDAIDDEGNADLASFREANKHTLDDDPVLASTATGDIALYKRGKAAIDNMKKGKVKNPFLVGLLIDPAHFESHVELYNEDNVEFALEKKLNSSQKAAIIKALNSNSIFALQGPPGTGKTQTITELVYQYNKMGKKVLISSQTHIAIDNVIERLPHEMNILPIRLVKDTKRANVKYLPDKLLDNLYESAYDKFSEKIENYNNFSKEIDAIQAHFESNKELYSNIKSRQQKCDKLNDEISGLRKESQIYADQLLELEREEKKAQANKKFLLEYYNNELDFNKITDDIYNEKYYEMLESLFKELGFDEEESITDHILMLKRRIGTTRIELLNELSNGKTGKSKEYIDIEKQIEDQKNAIKALEAMNNPSLASAIETTRSNINSLLRKLKDLDEDGGEKIVDLSNTTFYFVKDKSNPEMAISEEIKHINNANELYKKHVRNLMNSKFIKSLEENDVSKEKEKVDEEYRRVDVKIKGLEQELKEYLEPIKTQREHLTEYFNSFFSEKLNNNSLPESDEEKFNRIQEYINEQQEQFEEFKENYDLYRQIYEDSVQLLKDRKNILGRQRIKFTKDLFINNANVYGITCTSSATFYSDRNDYLKALNIGDVDVSKQDFDVVIIDEVSKANPIEIMIPLLYGKSVVLVGDQRQLPPIFKYRDSMFKDFTDSQMSKLFKNYTLDQIKEQVESSLFEEIYNLLKYNKAMLTQQYRFNSQIMKCVNVFYNDKLEAGWGSAQDNKKQHYLKVDYKHKGKDVVIFDPKYSTYWFNTNKYADDVVAYEKSKEGKTSLYNELEGKVTYELLKLLDLGYGDLKKNTPATYEKAIETTENKKPSVAVVSMYGAQIGYIKNLIKNDKYKFANIDVDISTVDNYQGKEKDIIIVNFVRNNKRGDAGEFIKKFNRINVAISRARNMLIVVGSKVAYLSNDEYESYLNGKTIKNKEVPAHYDKDGNLLDVSCMKSTAFFTESRQYLNDYETALIGFDLMKPIMKNRMIQFIEDSSVSSKVSQNSKFNFFISSRYKDILGRVEKYYYKEKNNFAFNKKLNSMLGFVTEYCAKIKLDYSLPNVVDKEFNMFGNGKRAKDSKMIRKAILLYKNQMKSVFSSEISKRIPTLTVWKLLDAAYDSFVSTVDKLSNRAVELIKSFSIEKEKYMEYADLSVRHIRGLADFIDDKNILDLKCTACINEIYIKQVLAYYYLSQKRGLSIENVIVYDAVSNRYIKINMNTTEIITNYELK